MVIRVSDSYRMPIDKLSTFPDFILVDFLKKNLRTPKPGELGRQVFALRSESIPSPLCRFPPRRTVREYTSEPRRATASQSERLWHYQKPAHGTALFQS